MEMQLSDVIIRAQSGDKAARDKLVEDNIGLVWSIVKRYTGRGYEVDDLFQIGSIGLIKAIDKFDLSFNVKFSTYAIPMIQGEIKRFLRDDGIVKVSRIAKENNWKIKKVVMEFEKQYAREPTIDEISKLTGLDKSDIIFAMETDITIDSINRTLYENDGHEVYLIDSINNGFDEIEKIVDNMVLEKVINILNEEEKNIIKMRYYEGKTQTQIADMMGMSQVQVSRYEKKIIERLRRAVRE